MTEQTSRGQLWFVPALGLAAAAIAIFTGIPLVRACMDAFLLRDAASVDASILDIERTWTTGEGSREIVTVTFQYDYEGRQYQTRTDRLVLFGKSVHYSAPLEAAMKNGDTVTCYVCSSNPEFSVFSRDFSIPLFLICSVFPLVFGGFAIMIAISFVRHQRMVAESL